MRLKKQVSENDIYIINIATIYENLTITIILLYLCTIQDKRARQVILIKESKSEKIEDSGTRTRNFSISMLFEYATNALLQVHQSIKPRSEKYFEETGTRTLVLVISMLLVCATIVLPPLNEPTESKPQEVLYIYQSPNQVLFDKYAI